MLRGTPPALAGDELIGVRPDGPDEDRLEDAVLTDRRGELVERLLVECEPRLFRVGLDPVDLDDPDADAAGGSVRRQEADDGGGELAADGPGPARES